MQVELTIIMEYCDEGVLLDFVTPRNGFRDEEGRLDYPGLLEVALDICKGMLHLHMHNICHNDLKAANVLLKSEGGGQGIRAKVVGKSISHPSLPLITNPLLLTPLETWHRRFWHVLFHEPSSDSRECSSWYSYPYGS
jgi:serine/threonine protein kinase